jgi:hypothetical protein
MLFGQVVNIVMTRQEMIIIGFTALVASGIHIKPTVKNIDVDVRNKFILVIINRLG